MEQTMHEITTYKEFTKAYTLKVRCRTFVRDQLVSALSLLRQIPTTGNWIRFPYYHHIFDDELISFESQLKYMSNFGDFISIDDAVDMLNSDQPVEGRYFCITFDDGFRNCITNVMPIFLKQKAPVSFYLPTKFIDACPESNLELCLSFFDDSNIAMNFLTWEDCRLMVEAGMTIGSHTVNHAILSRLNESESEKELRESKSIIEKSLNIECKHFSAPIGIPDRDFITERDPQIAQKSGYRSFLTSRRGSNDRIPEVMLIERDHILATWNNSQLRYFFSQ